MMISIDSWEYPTDFTVLQSKNPSGGNPLILRWPWISMSDAYIGCRFGDRFITHGGSRKKATLYPLAKFIQELYDTLWLDDDSNDEET